MPTRAAPCDVLRRLERDAALPDGADERFVGYGIMGLQLASGHALALRRWVQSSIGPAYTSVWLRTPDARWHFHADVAPHLACTRYTGAVATPTPIGAIALAWRTADTLAVEVPAARLRWLVRLRDSPALRLLALSRALVGERLLTTPAGTRLVEAIARWGLAAGPVRLAGRMPNGQRFAVAPQRLWALEHLEARLDGVELGPPVRPREPLAVGDFRLPRRPLLAAGVARFEAFDPRRHRAATHLPTNNAPESDP